MAVCPRSRQSFPGRDIQRTTDTPGSRGVQEGEAAGCCEDRPPRRGHRWRGNPSLEGEDAAVNTPTSSRSFVKDASYYKAVSLLEEQVVRQLRDGPATGRGRGGAGIVFIDS